MILLSNNFYIHSGLLVEGTQGLLRRISPKLLRDAYIRISNSTLYDVDIKLTLNEKAYSYYNILDEKEKFRYYI